MNSLLLFGSFRIRQMFCYFNQTACNERLYQYYSITCSVHFWCWSVHDCDARLHGGQVAFFGTASQQNLLSLSVNSFFPFCTNSSYIDITLYTSYITVWLFYIKCKKYMLRIETKFSYKCMFFMIVNDQLFYWCFYLVDTWRLPCDILRNGQTLNFWKMTIKTMST